jgi:hypothetical protein
VQAKMEDKKCTFFCNHVFDAENRQDRIELRHKEVMTENEVIRLLFGRPKIAFHQKKKNPLLSRWKMNQN